MRLVKDKQIGSPYHRGPPQLLPCTIEHIIENSQPSEIRTVRSATNSTRAMNKGETCAMAIRTTAKLVEVARYAPGRILVRRLSAGNLCLSAFQKKNVVLPKAFFLARLVTQLRVLETRMHALFSHYFEEPVTPCTLRYWTYHWLTSQSLRLSLTFLSTCIHRHARETSSNTRQPTTWRKRAINCW